MGTYFSITSYDNTIDKAIIEQAMDSAFALISNLESQLNPYESYSVIGQLNLNPERERRQSLPAPLPALLQEALTIAEKSNGHFDFTLWPVFRLWEFDENAGRIPTDDEIQQELGRVSWNQVTLENSHINLPAGVEIDLGGISKGFAVDEARRKMLAMGLKDFIIDAGGNLGIEWQKQQPIQILIRHPRKDGEYTGTFSIAHSCGISTSGDYHFYFVKDGIRYHHLLDPASGYPARGAISATILASTSTEADGLSTAVFVMGKDEGRQFIEQNENLEGLIVFQSEADTTALYISAGLQSQFEGSTGGSIAP